MKVPHLLKVSWFDPRVTASDVNPGHCYNVFLLHGIDKHYNIEKADLEINVLYSDKGTAKIKLVHEHKNFLNNSLKYEMPETDTIVKTFVAMIDLTSFKVPLQVLL